MLFTCSLLCTGWIKTQPAQKLLVRVKFTGNSYSYVCKRPLYHRWNTWWVPRQCRTRTRVYVNHHHHHFWQAPLRVRSAERRHQSPEWTVLSQVNCVVHIEVAGLNDAVDLALCEWSLFYLLCCSTDMCHSVHFICSWNNNAVTRMHVD